MIVTQSSTSAGKNSKKTLQQLREEKERSAQLEKTLKMLDNQWVGSGE